MRQAGVAIRSGAAAFAEMLHDNASLIGSVLYAALNLSSNAQPGQPALSNSFFYAPDVMGTVRGIGRGGRQWWTFNTGTGASVNAVAIAGDGRLLVGNSETLTAYVAPALGDLNCDGVVNLHDISPLILALVDSAQYSSRYPQCHRSLADVNGDDVFDFYDLVAFFRQLR